MSIQFIPGKDPREYVPGHRERGPKRREYTYQGLAEQLGVSLSTVQHYYPDNADALARLVHRQRASKRSELLTVAEVEHCIGEGKLPKWEDRWPRFMLWWCGACGEEVLFSRGHCKRCSGVIPAISFDNGGYFALRVGSRHVPYHRLVLPVAKGRVVYHKDRNKWNNRPDNLVSMTKGELYEKHRFGWRR